MLLGLSPYVFNACNQIWMIMLMVGISIPKTGYDMPCLWLHTSIRNKAKLTRYPPEKASSIWWYNLLRYTAMEKYTNWNKFDLRPHAIAWNVIGFQVFPTHFKAVHMLLSRDEATFCRRSPGQSGISSCVFKCRISISTSKRSGPSMDPRGTPFRISNQELLVS